MSDTRVPVAWLHADHRTAYVITDKVKQVWLQVDPKHVEHYTVPLYLDRWDGMRTTWLCAECKLPNAEWMNTCGHCSAAKENP